MKPHPYCYVILAVGMISQSFAQDALPPVVIEESVVETVTPAGVPEVVTEEVITEVHGIPAYGEYDPAFARRHLAMEPRPLPEPIPAQPVPAAPGSVVETTETTTVIDEPGRPRVYNVERNVVIVEGRELPYVTIPVLFVKETAELLDSESRQALEQTAATIKEIVATDPDAKFDIEGHTSTEGTDEFNMQLSVDRARRVYQELTVRYEIPKEVLTAHGYGENYPNFPSGTEEELTLDRRVLVVRVQ